MACDEIGWYYDNVIVWLKWIIFAGIVAKFVLNSTES